MSSDDVIKTVAKNLKYYFEVKRLEDGFDISGSNKLVLDRPQRKARPMSAAPRERYVKHKLEKNMAKHHFLSSLPECYYIYGPPKGRITRPELTGFGVPLKTKKKKPLKAGWPVLRTVPSTHISRGEAERLVNAATKLLVATETLEYVHVQRPASSRSGAPQPFESPRGAGRPSTAKYTWDINGRKVKQDQIKAYDDSFLAQSTGKERRQVSGRNKNMHYRPRSPTPSESTATTHTSYTTYTSDDRSPGRPRTSMQKSRGRTAPSRFQERPKSPKYGSRTIINVPHTDVHDEVTGGGGTQTLDEIGTQTDRKVYQQYKPEEDEVRSGPVAEYQIYVRTGNRIGASGKADVKIILYGDKGCSKEIVLKESKRNKIKFQKGKEDLFNIACHHVGKLRKIKIGHDYTELSYAWFLEGVSVYDMLTKRIHEFPCDQWLSGQDGDRRTYRELQCDRDRAIIEALKSEENLLDPQNETSDESERTGTKNNTSMRVNTSQSESRTPQTRQRKYDSDDSSGSSYTGSSESESDSDSESRSEEAVVEVSHKDSREDSTRHDDARRKDMKDVFYDDQTKGPTFTFRSINPDKNAERMRAEGESSGQAEEGRPVQETFLAGYKAGIDAANKEKHQHDKQERKEERSILNGQTIHDAARKGNLERIKQLLEHYPELKDSKDENGWTALHLATSTGQINTVKWLTTSGVSLDVETPTGYTPIHIAAMNGHVNVMMVLAAMGASIIKETIDKQTALHLAAKGGHAYCVKWLVANHGRLDAEDNFGRTPLYLAEEYEQSMVADFLRACERELANPESSFSMLHNQYRQGGRHLDAIEEERPGVQKDQGWMQEKDDSSEEKKKGEARPLSPELKEKKKIYDDQHTKMAERGVSFLDSIRQDVDED
ncbi:uncharacterized protein LOC121379401 isoform X2 [Gigantopelta aegis]|uniref:uncharacterized protein LOC121379401 isoform X2 n=1 Tax=Gigantopelta aegis TaxID=1735272 RepID=UPI001B889795|nr:uncharacterized protein LOC121379401 isoform X2 [Gigantopelta aegis]